MWQVKLRRYATSNTVIIKRQQQGRKTYIDNADLRTDQRVNCGTGPQVWSAVYPLVGPLVRILPVPYGEIADRMLTLTFLNWLTVVQLTHTKVTQKPNASIKHLADSRHTTLFVSKS